MNPKTAFFYDKIYAGPNMVLRPLIGLAQPHGLGFIAETKTSTCPKTYANI
jgi:hypothetical protein